MSTELAPQKTFEEKMMDRIRDSIGELMSQEDLKRIIEKGVEKALFEPRQKPRNYGGYESGPSLVDDAVTKYLESQMRTAVDKWIADNPDKLQKAIDNAVMAGVAGCVQNTMDLKFNWIFTSLVQQAQQNGLIPRS